MTVRSFNDEGLDITINSIVGSNGRSYIRNLTTSGSANIRIDTKDIQSITSPIIIFDASGSLSPSHVINIFCEAGQTINDYQTHLIDCPYGGVLLYSDGTNLYTPHNSFPQTVMTATSDNTDQVPATEDIPIVISFGSDQGTAADAVSLTSDVFTFNQSGWYELTGNFSITRSINAGNETLAIQAYIDGIEAGQAIFKTLANSNLVESGIYQASLCIEAGTTLSFETAAINIADTVDIGLREIVAQVAGWNNAAPATMIIKKII